MIHEIFKNFIHENIIIIYLMYCQRNCGSDNEARE